MKEKFGTSPRNDAQRSDRVAKGDTDAAGAATADVPPLRPPEPEPQPHPLRVSTSRSATGSGDVATGSVGSAAGAVNIVGESYGKPPHLGHP